MVVASEISDNNNKSVLPIDRLKIHGTRSTTAIGSLSKLSMTSQTSVESSQSTALQNGDVSDTSIMTSSNKPMHVVRRYEFMRRNLARSDKTGSPTFIIEGRKVHHKQHIDENEEKREFDTMGLLDFKNVMKNGGVSADWQHNSMLPKAKTDLSSLKPNSSMSMVLPMLYIEGPGFSHQLRSKSTSLPDDQHHAEMDDITTDTTHGEHVWSEIENIDFRNPRSVKKNNFFTPVGTRVGDDHSDLVVDSTSQKSKTITLQLQTASQENKPKHAGSVNGFPIPTRASKSPREKLYRSATQLSASRPLFRNINSYLNFNNKRQGLYSSEQYIDSNNSDSVLKPLENKQNKPISRKLVTKYSDMEIQKELNEFFKIRPVK